MENKIICPNCSSEISVEKALSSRYKDHYEQEFKKQLADQQKQIAEKITNDENKKFLGKIVTKISLVKNYCPAEEYHQKYLEKR